MTALSGDQRVLDDARPTILARSRAPDCRIGLGRALLVIDQTGSALLALDGT
jgi:hypothetical protein